MESLSARPEISVVVSTMDRPTSLDRCLRALSAGRCLPDEVVVVDQGDPLPVESVVDANIGRGLEIKHLRQPRTGLAASQNLGVRTARGEIVAVTDDDCVPDDCWLEVVASTFADSPGLDLLTGRILSLPPVGDRSIPVSNRTSETRAEHRSSAIPWDVGSGGNFAIRRSSYMAVGGNDERLGTGTPGRAGNDLDLFHRILRNDGSARYEPDLVVRHERATPAERRQRRFSYGFGVGACVGRWLRDGDRFAWRVLLSWLKLRFAELRRRRSLAAVGEEARVVWGTACGLRYGLACASAWERGRT